MSLIHIKDMGGQTMPLRQHGDVRLPPVFPVDVFPEIPKLRMREDDVLIASYVRSGTHWVYELVGMLLNNNAETIKYEKRDGMLENTPISEIDKIPSRRVLSAHLHFRYLPEDIKTKPCQVIYLMRDPRDALVSWHKLLNTREHYEYKGEFKHWLPVCANGDMHWGSWFDHVRDWEKTFEDNPHLSVHYWFYEDMKKNPLEELRRLSEFLGTNTDEALLKAIVDKCQLEKMRTDKNIHERLRTCEVHYVTGIDGGWKKMFTVEQYEEFEKGYREKMKGSKFYDRYLGPVAVL